MIRRSSPAVLAALCAGALVLLLVGRELLVRATLGRAGARARQLAEVSREMLPPVDLPIGPRREAFSWLLDPAGDDEVVDAAAEEAAGAPVRPAAPRLGPVPAPVVGLGRDQVLGLAERGAMPRGASRAATRDLPAGIEILNGGALGIGWFPGDRLIAVNDVSVTDRAEVVRRVLEGRARREAVITATVARRTSSGVFTYRVLVEQPYLAPDPSAADAAAPQSPPGPQFPGAKP